MSEQNVKIVKVDPTGFYLNKEDDSRQSVASDVSESGSETSDISSESENGDLVHLKNVPTNVSVIKEPAPSPQMKQQNHQQEGGATNKMENYMPVKKNEEEDEESVNSQYSEKEMDSEELPQTNEPPTNKQNTNVIPTHTPETTTSRNDYYSDTDEEIIDMTDNKLYEVLASVFEDEEGENVSENLSKLNRNLEKHNELLEKILFEFIEMNKEKHKERKFFETLAFTVQNHSKLLKNNKKILEETEEVLDDALSTENEPTENEETDNKRGGRKTIKRMKNRISTPNVKKI